MATKKKDYETIASFKRKYRLKELPQLHHSTSETKRWAYMLFFKFRDKVYTLNTYGPPGYIEPAKEIPQDLRKVLMPEVPMNKVTRYIENRLAISIKYRHPYAIIHLKDTSELTGLVLNYLLKKHEQWSINYGGKHNPQVSINIFYYR